MSASERLLDLRPRPSVPAATPAPMPASAAETAHSGERAGPAVRGSDVDLDVLRAYLPSPANEGIVLGGYEVSVRFGGVQALNGATIEVPARAFVGLIGPNGAGKSTLFDILNGFTTPDMGRVEAFGREVTRLQPWDRARFGISRTFQANHIDPDLTVFENLHAGAYLRIRGGILRGIARTPITRSDETLARRAAIEVARLLDLEPVLEVPARELDFGAQRRIEIGRSVMSGPRVLLLDEPTAGLDGHEAMEFIGVVRRMHNELGLAVLLIEHYVRAVLRNCDPIYVLDAGQVIASGTPEEIVTSERVRAAYLGGAEDA